MPFGYHAARYQHHAVVQQRRRVLVARGVQAAGQNKRSAGHDVQGSRAIDRAQGRLNRRLPYAMALAIPSLLIVATSGADELHVTLVVRSWVRPSL